MPISNFQPIRLLDPDCCYKFTYFIENSADPDQLASSEANWSGSTVFKGKVYPGSAGQGLTPSTTGENSADNKVMIFFSKNRIWQFTQIISTFCMKCLVLFLGRKYFKIFQNVVYWIFSQHVYSINKGSEPVKYNNSCLCWSNITQVTINRSHVPKHFSWQYISHDQINMDNISHNFLKCTFGHVTQVKIQISMCICSVCSEYP